MTLAKGSDKGSIEVILNITWLFVLLKLTCVISFRAYSSAESYT